MDVPRFDPESTAPAPGVGRIVFDSLLGRWSLSHCDPPPALVGFVARMWETHGFVDYSHEKILPSGHVELIVNLGLPHETLDPIRLSSIGTYRAAWLSGLQERSLIAAPTYDANRYGSLFVGASLEPTAVGAVFGIPADGITNRVVELSEILGDTTVELLRERLYHARDTAGRFRALAGELSRWRRTRGVESSGCVVGSVGILRRHAGSERVDQLCRTFGVSRKHLAFRFREEIGLSPKRYARLLRFRSLLDALSGPTVRPHWAELALEHGYYDQSHLVKEFQLFAGETPTRFLGLRAPDGQSILYE